MSAVRLAASGHAGPAVSWSAGWGAARPAPVPSRAGLQPRARGTIGKGLHWRAKPTQAGKREPALPASVGTSDMAPQDLTRKNPGPSPCAPLNSSLGTRQPGSSGHCKPSLPGLTALQLLLAPSPEQGTHPSSPSASPQPLACLQQQLLQQVKRGTLALALSLCLSVAAAAPLPVPSPGLAPALAADALQTCKCLINNCRGELLRCLGDLNCAANIACLQACNGRADETECQIGCGDLFANSVVDRFNACAVSQKGCVPQKPDENLFPVPPDTALVPAFDVSRLQGDWFISAGLNPTFDTFDCQLHSFRPTEPNAFQVNLTWRIRTPDGGFFTRSAVQDFKQELQRPAVLLNHDNEFLHYQDDWYVISSKMEGGVDDYFLVYYRGKNDAWDGYGGAVLYTRSKTVPESIVGEVKRACQSVGLEFERFLVTDNSCPAQQPLLARLEKTVEDEVVLVENKVLEAGEEELALLQSLGKGLQELQKDKDVFLAKLSERERELLARMEAAEMGAVEDLEDLFGNALPLRSRR